MKNSKRRGIMQNEHAMQSFATSVARGLMISPKLIRRPSAEEEHQVEGFFMDTSQAMKRQTMPTFHSYLCQIR